MRGFRSSRNTYQAHDTSRSCSSQRGGGMTVIEVFFRNMHQQQGVKCPHDTRTPLIIE
jgi:hypothetical protein